MIFFPLRDDNPLRIKPWITYALIAANVLSFLWQMQQVQSELGRVELLYGLIPAQLLAAPADHGLNILTSMFLHGSWYHLASNLWFLHVFGDNLEETLGRTRYLFFYLACGAVAALAQVAITPHSQTPMIGASGAIAGVVGGYLVLYPRAPILSLNLVPLLWLLFGIFTLVPAWLIAGSFFVSNLLSALLTLQNVDQAGIAFFAHLGGFVAGFFGAALSVDRRDLPRRVAPPWREARQRRYVTRR